jgi:uncharacterized protein YndB with AHSA1/START domain
VAVTVKKFGLGKRELTFSTKLAPEAVYDYLSDFEKHSEWVPELVKMEKTTEGPAGVGTTYKTTEALKPGSSSQDTTYCEITKLERPRLIEWQARTAATSGPMAMRSHWSFIIEPADGGSVVTQKASLDPPNVFANAFLRLFIPIADGLLGGMGATPKNVTRHVENLQKLLDEKAGA